MLACSSNLNLAEVINEGNLGYKNVCHNSFSVCEKVKTDVSETNMNDNMNEKGS